MQLNNPVILRLYHATKQSSYIEAISCNHVKPENKLLIFVAIDLSFIAIVSVIFIFLLLTLPVVENPKRNVYFS